MITGPSPNGRWNARRSARANSSTSTPIATSRIDASTKPQDWKAISESSTFSVPPRRTTNPVCWYQGRNIEPTSPSAASAASCCSA